MHPEILDGTLVLVDRTQRCAVGDLVVVFFTPEFAEKAGCDAWLKRLVHPVPSWVRDLPHKLVPGSQVEPLIGVRSNANNGVYMIPLSAVAALHHVVGPCPPELIRGAAHG